MNRRLLFRHVTIVVVLLLLVSGLWALSAIVPLWAIGDWPTRSQFGDYFGFSTSLFTAIGFIGVGYSLVLLQVENRETKLRHDEIVRAIQSEVGQIRQLRTDALLVHSL